MAAIRARYPAARIVKRSAWGPPPVGTAAIAVIETAPVDQVLGLYYWLDTAGKLVGIEVFRS